MTAPTAARSAARGSRARIARVRGPAPIPRRALIVGEAYSARLGASAVTGALARGLRAAGAPEPEIVLLEDDADVGAQLARLGFDERMRASRALIIAAAMLDPHTIARTAAFEVATRARQTGVPTYAVARESRLDSFDARLLDLQLVLEARSPRSLEAAGRALAAIV